MREMRQLLIFWWPGSLLTVIWSNIVKFGAEEFVMDLSLIQYSSEINVLDSCLLRMVGGKREMITGGNSSCYEYYVAVIILINR